MTFHDLFRVPTRGGEPFAPDRRGDLFPGVVRGSRRLHLWRPGDPAPARGTRLLVGVSTWSGYEMNLLDLVDAATAPDRVDVFDIDTHSAESADIDRFIPGASAFLQSPFAGLWRDGVLTESAGGWPGHDLVRRACRLDPAEVDGVMSTILTRK